MNIFFISLILSSVITVLSLFIIYQKDGRESQSTHALKTFVISFVTTFIGLYLTINKQDLEIEIGEADF